MLSCCSEQHLTLAVPEPQKEFTMSEFSDTAKLIVDGNEIDLDVYTGVEGERSIDITTLYNDL